MRRKIQTVPIRVGLTFYNILEARRKAFQKKLGFRKNLTQTAYTEMLAKSGNLKLPKLNIKLFGPIPKKFKNVKKQKS